MHNSKKEIGNYFEKIAIRYFKDRNYYIINNNYRTKYGEIDIICKKYNTFVFVEVRYRNSIFFGGPEASITSIKQKKIIKTAKHFITSNNLENNYFRFDVLCISKSKLKININWIKNAFYDGE